jgi:hypothetical protein
LRLLYASGDHLFVMAEKPVAATLLGAIHPLVGIFEQLLPVAGLLSAAVGNANAGG